MAVPRCPKVAAISRIHRGGRPVTRTNRAPAASTRAKAETVRSEIVPSPRMIVPSRSVATSNGKSPTPVSLIASARVAALSPPAVSANVVRPELDADPGAGRTGRLGDPVLPGPLAAAAHHDEIPVPEVVPQRRRSAVTRAQRQRPSLAQGHDRDHGVLARPAPDRVAVQGDAVSPVPV